MPRPEGTPPAGIWDALKAGVKRSPSRARDRGHPAFWSANFIKTVGVPAALAFALLRAWQADLTEERQLRAEQHRAIIAALEQERGGLSQVRDSLDGLTVQAQELHGAAATVQGMVLGRLRCPNLSCPACPRIPACPEPSGPIIVTSPSTPLPTAERPSGEGGKPATPTRPLQRREP